MMSGAARGRGGLEALQAELTATLDDLKEQRWTVSEAFFRRSEVRSGLGDRVGALEDANVALAMFPEHAKYLIRASHVSLPYEASQLLERAKKTVDPRSGNEEAEQNLAALKSLERRLKPFDLLPDEVLLLIFHHVQQDWERLPSPFQLPHVCARWKRIAESTAALWQDTRILRVHDKAYTEKSLYFAPIQKVYRLGEREVPKQYICARRDVNHLSLLRLCAGRSHHKLTHFELEVAEWGEEGSEMSMELADIGLYSSDTLKSGVFIHSNQQQRQRYADARDLGISSMFAATSLDLVLLCPQLQEVELSVGELLGGDDDIEDFRDMALKQQAPSLRRMRLDCFDGFCSPQGARARDFFLQKASALQSLTIMNLPDFFDMAAVELDSLPFVLQLLATCAETLVELVVEGHTNILAGAQAAGITAFPRLRSYRHVRRRYWSRQDQLRVHASDMAALSLPRLVSIEAPADIITKLPRAPCPDMVLRLGHWETIKSTCERSARWLLDLGNEQSPRSLTILDPFPHGHRDNVYAIVDALTPSCTGRVACAKLEQLLFVAKPDYTPDDVGYTHLLDPAPLPPDHEHQEASSVPRLARMMAERGRVAQRLPPVEGGSDDGGTVWTRCEALTVELDGWTFLKEK